MMTDVNMFRKAVQDAARMANTTVEKRDGIVLHRYPNYEAYRNVQIAGNRAKLSVQFVKESHIKRLSAWVNGYRPGPVGFALCHGTRQGYEQLWFRQYLQDNADVIGTDISDTCLQFPNSVVWDFHEDNPEWHGRAGFVYSNSWDHAYDPHKALAHWYACLRPGGMLLLDHTIDQTPRTANALDPFGATLNALQNTASEATGVSVADQIVLDWRRDNPEYTAQVLVVPKPA